MVTKKDDEDFEKSAKSLICDNGYVDGNVKVTHHFHITGKQRNSAHRDCNIKVNLTLKRLGSQFVKKM